MKIHQSPLLLGFVSYGIGVAVGMFLILVAAWADMESSAYGFARLANAGLSGLHCPVLMTPHETGTISLNISNPTDNQISPSIKTMISTPQLPQEFLENIKLTPGESKKLEWRVDSENIDLGRFIFAKVLLFSAYPVASRETTCGIFIVDLPGTGQMIMPVLIVLSLIGIGGGMYLVNRYRASSAWLAKHMGSLAFLTVVVILGLILSFVGGWVLSMIVLVIGLLMITILLSSLLLGRSR